MALSAQTRQTTVQTHRVHDNDTGSPTVQIAMLTERIREVSEHLKTHHHDFSSRRGLLQMVSRRNRLLRYLSRTEHDRYSALIQKLGLRK